SFVLAGLLMENQSNVEEKIPGLGNIPILGAFFKRSRQLKEKQELVIVATPRLVTAHTMPEPGELPGARMADFDHSVADMLLNTHGLDDELAEHGMMP
ncbi:MAG: pilus assembly protein CpaC, partial [Alphaproteobacteria bacterium]